VHVFPLDYGRQVGVIVYEAEAAAALTADSEMHLAFPRDGWKCQPVAEAMYLLITWWTPIGNNPYEHVWASIAGTCGEFNRTFVPMIAIHPLRTTVVIISNYVDVSYITVNLLRS